MEFFFSKPTLQGSRQCPLFQSYPCSTSDVRYFAFTVCILRSFWCSLWSCFNVQKTDKYVLYFDSLLLKHLRLSGYFKYRRA